MPDLYSDRICRGKKSTAFLPAVDPTRRNTIDPRPHLVKSYNIPPRPWRKKSTYRRPLRTLGAAPIEFWIDSGFGKMIDIAPYTGENGCQSW